MKFELKNVVQGCSPIDYIASVFSQITSEAMLECDVEFVMDTKDQLTLDEVDWDSFQRVLLRQGRFPNLVTVRFRFDQGVLFTHQVTQEAMKARILEKMPDLAESGLDFDVHYGQAFQGESCYSSISGFM